MLIESELLTDELEQQINAKVQTCRIGASTEEAVALDLIENARSYEWSIIVIAVTCYASSSVQSRYLAYSRAVTRLIVVL